MPNFRQLLIGALLLVIAIVIAAGITLRTAVHPLGEQDAESKTAQIFNVDMGLSADVS
jgi:hypothetical protein